MLRGECFTTCRRITRIFISSRDNIILSVDGRKSVSIFVCGAINQEDDLSGPVWKDNSECCLFLSPNQSTIKNLSCGDNRSFRLHLRPVAFIRAKLCLLYIMLIPTEIRTSKEKYFTLNVDQAAYYLSNTYFLLAGVGNFLWDHLKKKCLFPKLSHKLSMSIVNVLHCSVQFLIRLLQFSYLQIFTQLVQIVIQRRLV